MAGLSLDLRRKRFPAVGRIPARTVLGPIRLRIEPGERVALIGPSGSGKTTLLGLIAGLDDAFEGRIERPPGRIGMVFQEPRLLPWRSTADNLRIVLPDTPEREGRVARALASVGLEAAAQVHASRLSLGMARRAALARAFVVDPPLVLLDEPFVSLDPPLAQSLRCLVLDLVRASGATLVVVTHDRAEAVMLSDRILELGGSPAGIEAEHPVCLAPEARRDPRLVAAFAQATGFAPAGRFAAAP